MRHVFFNRHFLLSFIYERLLEHNKLEQEVEVQNLAARQAEGELLSDEKVLPLSGIGVFSFSF